MVHAIVQAVGLVLVVEGLIYAAAPQAMKRLMAEVPKLSVEQLSHVGVAALALGVGVVWLAMKLI